jgi:peptidoglycan/xylan/chitin deacetylase (PgdA/CDA1 family)
VNADRLAQDRRSFLAVMALGLLTVAGCGTSANGAPGSSGASPASGSGALTSAPPPSLPPIPPPKPGPPQIISSAAGASWDPPTTTNQIALTVDDGYDQATVAAYADFANRTGIPLTFNPNGCYSDIWNGHAEALKPLIEKGQVQIGNHTYSHQALPGRSASAIQDDIHRNEEWVNKTFGITTRPYFRPPFGNRNGETDQAAAEIGWTRILMWDGTLGDSNLLTPNGLMSNAKQWIKAGRIVLGHANHPTVTHLYDQIQQLIADRKLVPVTLDTMFGTSRATG